MLSEMNKYHNKKVGSYKNIPQPKSWKKCFKYPVIIWQKYRTIKS